MTTYVVAACLAIVALSGGVTKAGAQPLGVFRWQLQPYCNVLALNVTLNGTVYTLDGVDDQCGATRRASVAGTASLNADGSVEIGLATVISPTAVPVHIDARIDVATLGGTWRDSAGNGGAFVFTPGAGTGGSPRPVGPSGLAPGSVGGAQVAPGAIGAMQADLSQLQARVMGSCPAGHSLQGVNADGTVTCAASGTSWVKRTAFNFALVLGQSAPPTTLTTITFISPMSGVAVLRGRGFCNVSSIAGSNNIVTVAAGTSATDAFFPFEVSNVGVASVLAGVSGVYQPSWSAERMLNVTAGTTYSDSLFARHESGDATNNCSGSFTAQVSGVLP